ncbi:LLM class flavin-dependent oxidoreductase [Ilumatobacter sp.]|uniref:LLM class flavin-dependent oxidoreductase n=1 Tax=Ilumatobacter sp. TaxID=1967498 RepID=UPI003AF45D3A
MTVVDVQVSPAVNDWAAVRDVALAAEAAGFGAFHVFDHLAGLPLGGDSMIESFSLLGALAEATTTIELGTMVANVWNRQIGTLITAAASIAHLSGRQFHLGVGAGAAPTSRWANEQHAVGHRVEPDMVERQRRVQDVIDLAAASWTRDRSDHLSTFPLPSPTPSIIVGVNSIALSRVAGRCADGINVQWNRPRRDDYLAAANEAAGDRPFIRTAYHPYDPALLDEEHPTRVAMTERRIDRLVLAEFGTSPQLPANV